jgi:ATP-dependent Clp protease ATP-binding subunit ClpC
VVSFKNTLIILTSNVGSKMIAKGGRTLGFDIDADEDDDREEADGAGGAAYKRMRDKVLEELKNYFRPEMLNRLDEIVCFRQLEKASVARIARIMLRDTAERMRAKGFEMALTQAAMTKLLATGFDQEYGARPLRRAITSIVDDNLSEAMLQDAINPGDTAVVDFDEAAEEFGVVSGTSSGSAGEPEGVATEVSEVSSSGNTYLGVSVVAVRGDLSAAGFDVAWSSVEEEGAGARVRNDVAPGVSRMNNSVSRGPVPVNDDVAA